MARFNDANSKHIYSIAEQWCDRCLIRGKSILWPDRDVWSAVTLQQFKACFIDRPDTSDRNFGEKFKAQLATGSDDATRLACELLLIYFLFPTNVARRRKIELIREVASWKGIEVNESAYAFGGFNEGIGNAGLAYNTGRPNELTYLARFAIAVSGKDEAGRAALFRDHKSVREVLDDLAENHREEFGRSPQLRHVLLYLLFPDDYERIASEGHKGRIREAFSEVIGPSVPPDTDDYLKAIRDKLQQLMPDQELDFYWEPLRECWYTDSDGESISPLQALRIKRQIVLHGPPGTGKTYQARHYAESLIRQELLRQWKPARYFSSLEKVKDLVAEHTHRVQFHPGYGYEDFVRGVQISTDGRTEYRDGVILRLVEDMKTLPEADRQVPVVLILDEMNRADLSKVLGECFSLLEDRDSDVVLAGHDERPRRVRLPPNLYVIGTMNLIDQSLEHVDFALRRRFLWFFRGFSRDDFLEVSAYRWQAIYDDRSAKNWGKVEPEFEILAERAGRLNKLIESNAYLGEQYQIGHTYFCDVVAFAQRFIEASERRRNRVLFNNSGAAIEPVIGLWRYSLAPLLKQYLSGIDTSEREALMKQAEAVLLAGAGA